MAKEKWNVLKKVKAKKAQPMRFTNDASEAEKNGGLYYVNAHNVPRFKYGTKEKVYLVDHFKFYDKNGVVYTVRSLNFLKQVHKYHDKRPFNGVLFDTEIKLKRLPKFDGSVFFISKGKDYWDNTRYNCNLYVPVEYIHALGYTIEEREERAGYTTEYEKLLRTPYFDIELEKRNDYHFDERLKELQKLVKKAKDHKDLIDALAKTMNMMGVEEPYNIPEFKKKA